MNNNKNRRVVNTNPSCNHHVWVVVRTGRGTETFECQRYGCTARMVCES